MRFRYFFLLMLLFAQCSDIKTDESANMPIDLLIISGSNNHDWEKTTPLLVKMYAEAGIFHVEVTENPDTLSYQQFNMYDAVVSNYTPWPEHDKRWPPEAEQGLVSFVEEGGGFVLFHAASAAFYDWPEYQQMVGTTWGDSTTHGKTTAHKVQMADQKHPITQGVSNFWITDELWVNSGVNSDLNVLASSYSDPSNKGRGEMEPVVHWNSRGKGRIFHNVLGHHERALKNTGWKTLMLRGTEWAATGEVTIPVPVSLSDEQPGVKKEFSWIETDTTLALLDHGNVIWQYNFNTIKGKPFFHPVNIDNATISWLSPEDHPWHLGIWHSWKFINGVNYWEYDLTKDVAPFNFLGVTEVRKISFEKGMDHSCNILLDVYYHEKNGPDLIREKRLVHISPPEEKGQFFIDYSFDLKALLDDVELNRTPLPHEKNGKSYGGYAGLSIRFSQDMFDPIFINPDGSTDMNHGKPYAWRYYGLKNIRGNKTGAAIFTKPQNLNYPEPWFFTDNEDHPFYYFSPAPIFNGPHTLDKGEKLTLNYRMQFYTGEMDHHQLKRDYTRYLNSK